MMRVLNIRSIIVSVFLSVALGLLAQSRWIIADSDKDVNAPNTWIAFRKDFNLKKVPSEALAKIGADSKYWLWVNGDLVVFEGGLKRGPSPSDSYYDEVNLAPYLKKGNNQIAVLLWHFGKDGFSHKNSGKSGLIFDMKAGNVVLYSDSTWHSRIHPAYTAANDPAPNYRLAESNIRFIADNDIPGWQTADCGNEKSFMPSKEIGQWGDAPWNKLVKRPVPLWKNYGVIQAPFERQETEKEIVYTVSLPYNMQMTPVLDLTDANGSTTLFIETNHSHAGGADNLRAEYVTSKGHNIYESLGWLNGEQLIIRHNKNADITINSLGYRETGYDCFPEGKFSCDNDFVMRFWNKALRTLYVNMRDTYFDCPDRERAQWWGDAVVLMSESFYTYSTSAHALMHKAIHELVDWQKEDGVLFSPIPAGNYSDELPAQMLASIGEYGFWNYYMNTGDIETIRYVYPAVKKYLGLWSLDDTGLTAFRKGGWSWGDWGENIDIRLILAAWHYLALKSAAQMAVLVGEIDDVAQYESKMSQIKQAFNACWNGYAFRHPEYQKETDDRVQAMAVLSGIADKDKYDKIFNLFKTQWHASPYMEKYVMEALFKINQGEYALQRMEKRFANMVNDTVYSTLFEDWRKGGSGGGSTNHAWSGGPLTVISRYLCGVSPLEPGFSTFLIAPDPVSFKTASISVPTVSGTIASEFENSENNFILKINVPESTKAVVALPSFVDDISKVKIDGKAPSGSQMKVNAEYVQKGKIYFNLNPGNHVVSCIYD